ncbi:hypothetical protein DVA76_18755, partial [Acinetobacter baumannii]
VPKLVTSKSLTGKCVRTAHDRKTELKNGHYHSFYPPESFGNWQMAEHTHNRVQSQAWLV